MYRQWSPLIADEANTFYEISECDTSIPQESGVFIAFLMCNIRQEVFWSTCGEAEGGMSCFSPVCVCVQQRETHCNGSRRRGDELSAPSFPQHSSSDMSVWLPGHFHSHFSGGGNMRAASSSSSGIFHFAVLLLNVLR